MGPRAPYQTAAMRQSSRDSKIKERELDPKIVDQHSQTTRDRD